MALIDILKKEHGVILNAFAEVERLGVDSSEGLKKLLKIKELLLGHLHKEDEVLYPQLEQIITSKSLSLTFKNDMKCVSKRALDLICTCEKQADGIDVDAVKLEFSAVYKELQARIQREECMLYPEYIRLTGDQDS